MKLGKKQGITAGYDYTVKTSLSVQETRLDKNFLHPDNKSIIFVKDLKQETMAHPNKNNRTESRITRWAADIPERAYKLCLLGLSNDQLATAFGVGVSIFNIWIHKYPELKQAMKLGRHEADAEITATLFKRASGYKYTEDKVFVYKGQIITQPVEKEVVPDTEAIKFWLKNRQPALWNDTFKHEHSGKVKVEKDKHDLKDLSDEEFELVKKLGLKDILAISNGEQE